MSNLASKYGAAGDEWLTPEEVRQILRFKEIRTVYLKLRSGELAGVKFGRVWRVRRSAVEGGAS